MIGRYTKRPVSIEAGQHGGTMASVRELMAWLFTDWNDQHEVLPYYVPETGAIMVPTESGVCTCRPGDWIAKGVKGEFYPIPGAVFTASYDPTPEEELGRTATSPQDPGSAMVCAPAGAQAFPSRSIEHHVIDAASAALNVMALDGPSHGGASHLYRVLWPDPSPLGDHPALIGCTIAFQHGPIQEHGINGVTCEALLAVVIDRLAAFQAGPFASHENGQALADARNSLGWLHTRTKERAKRSVEGTSAK